MPSEQEVRATRPIVDIDPGLIRSPIRPFEVQAGQVWTNPPEPEASMPEKIRVGAVTYRVQRDQTTPRELAKRGETGQESMGHADSPEQLILVHPEQGEDQQRVTLLHELLHVVWFGVGLGESCCKSHEEHVIAAVDDLLVDVLQRNPELVRYLAS